jgi:hypothetical protein
MDIDALLQEWGAAQRLDADLAEEIRSSIVDGLDVNWWSDFTAQFAHNVMMSVQPFSMAA